MNIKLAIYYLPQDRFSSKKQVEPPKTEEEEEEGFRPLQTTFTALQSLWTVSHRALHLSEG